MRRKILAGILIMVLGMITETVKVYSKPVEAGFGKIKVNGLMQFWYQNEMGKTPADTFRLRRGEVRVSGEIIPEVSWSIMIDPAQVREDDFTTVKVSTGGTEAVESVIKRIGRKSLLQDFLITIRPHKYFSIDFGQYKTPFGMEGLKSSSKLDLIERSALATQFKWADYRDIGFTVKGYYNIGNIKTQLTLGLFNGEGQNKLDANEPMDFAGRLVVKPIEQLHLGVAHYNGKTGADKTENVRTGIEAEFTKDPVSIYGEYATGRKGGKSKYTYYITTTYKFLKSYQAVLRYDHYEPDVDKKDDAITEITVGVNYFIEKHNSKIQLNYVSKIEEGTSVNNDLVRINVQIAF